MELFEKSVRKLEDDNTSTSLIGTYSEVCTRPYRHPIKGYSPSPKPGRLYTYT